MTIEERVAAAIAASRTGSTDDWRAYRADASRMIAHYDAVLATHPARSAKKR